MAQRKVDGVGINNVPWSNVARSDFFWCVVMVMCTIFMWVIVSVAGSVLVWASGMFHRPFFLQWPLMMIFTFYTTLIFYFVNIEAQSLS